VRDIDSDALSQVTRQLGVSGIGEGVAILDDQELRQVLDVGPAVRRGRADVANGGWFWGVLHNVHLGASALSSFINPYEADGFELTSYPANVDVSRFDIWIIGATLRVFSGASSITNASFFMGAPLRSLAFGKDDMAAAVTPVGGGFIMASWGNSVFADTTLTWIARREGQQFVPLNIRMPRGSNLIFDSTSPGVTTYELAIIMGLFPIGLGQDVAG